MTDCILPTAGAEDDDALFAVPPVTVLGIGNVILQDEGFGVRAVELLDMNYEFPDTVQIIDGGTLGVELLQFVTGTQKLLVIDSINGKEPAGSLFRFQDDAVMEHFQDKLSAHEVGIQDVLATLSVTGRRIPEVVVLGVQPYDVGAGVALTEPMKALLPAILEASLAELRRWGIEPVKKEHDAVLDDTIVAEERIWE
ncbi:HyaD/HybD family hydrogenase maturation endopeptidase [Selenomonas sp. TAMA-11512]|uniref:HyaD/HybD family hydrogenase maturation endopeptidase n=1 Tax=Selenomonas sp. TAMA-11512 TaxID=3095337 RepID=UPI003085E966|nr:HyaD/HybD family hydrogenase maturation endopeptidase [Selenomonas sp. TAMA-11512]